LIRTASEEGAVGPAGVDIIQSEVVELIGESGVQAIRLKEGKIIGTNLPVFIPAATKANIDFLKDAELKIERDSLCVNESMQTAIENIYASGAVCLSTDSYGIQKTWFDSIAQSKILVDHLIQAMGG
jgi:NAD(P)H-nitrite reductase large subunit